MNQVSSFIIIAIVLAVLAVIVVVSLMKRAKHDPASFRNPILEHVNVSDDAYEFYDIVSHYNNPRDTASRAARPQYPDSDAYKEELAAMEEKSRKAQEELEKQDIEDVELWEADMR